MKNPILILVILGAVACASPQKSFNKGDFDKAFSSSLKNLKKGKNERKDKSILNKSFNELLKDYQNSKEDLLGSNLIEDWELAYLSAEDIILKYEDANRYLDSEFDSPMRTISNDNIELAKDIADNYMILADEEMLAFEETGNKLIARDAHGMYLKVVEYAERNKFLDLNKKLEYSLAAGLIRVLVLTEVWDRSYSWDVNRKFDDIERVKTDPFTVVDFEKNNGNYDCVIEVEFSSLNINENTTTENESFSERVIDGYNTVTDTSGTSKKEPIYKTVTGEVVITKIKRLYNWRVQVRPDGIRQYCDYGLQYLEAEEGDWSESYRITGDERAIPETYKNGDEGFRRSESDIIDDLIDNIYDDFRREYF